MSAPLLLVPLVTVLASLLLVSQPAQPLSIIKKVFESKSFYLVFIADGHRLELLRLIGKVVKHLLELSHLRV